MAAKKYIELDGLKAFWAKVLSLFTGELNKKPTFTPVGEGEGVPDPPFVGGGESSGVSVTVVDDLTSDSTTSALSARQGKALKALIDAIKVFSGSYSDLTDKPTIPTLLSQLSGDATHRIVTDAEKTAWNGKVDKVAGKGLSTEDFTTALKTKLEGLNNYNDTEVRGLITSLQSALDTLTGTGNTTEAIDTMNEIMAFLENYKNTDNLASVLQTLQSTIEGWVEAKGYLTQHQSLSGKQDVISDIATIRSDASKGNTAYGYFSDGKLPYSSLSGAPSIPTISDDYSSTSSNGMSGKAVASAISGVRQVPSASASNNGQVLSVVNGVPTWVSTVTVYSGSAAPADSLGKDGDIYIQA